MGQRAGHADRALRALTLGLAVISVFSVVSSDVDFFFFFFFTSSILCPDGLVLWCSKLTLRCQHPMWVLF